MLLHEYKNGNEQGADYYYVIIYFANTDLIGGIEVDA